MYQNIYVKTNTKEAWIWDDETGLSHFDYTPYAWRRDPSGETHSIFGDPVVKVTDFDRGDDSLFESDVPETTRILVDLYGDSDLPSTGNVVMPFDIEVEMITGVPDPKLGNNEITSIAWLNQKDNKYYILILDKNNEVQPNDSDNRVTIPCLTEKILLQKFLDALATIKPTIFTGWNIAKFDIPYLFNRIKAVLGKTAANKLSPIGHVFYSPYRDTYSIAGISSLDYMLMYKKFAMKELPSYSLDYVCNLELGRGKTQYEGNLDELMRDDINTFIDYNINDVELVMELDKKLDFIELVRGICHVGHVPYEDYIYSSKYIEGAFLTYLKKLNLVAPSKPVGGRARMEELKESGEQGFEGAYVKEPIPGRYEWVYDLDLASLYPSLIMTLNISPETKIAKIENWNAEEFLLGKRDEYILGDTRLSREEFKAFIEKFKYSISSNGVLYDTTKPGIVPTILNEWFNLRVEYKNNMEKYGHQGDNEKYLFYKKRQLVQKTMLNSFYGVMGLPVSRFYDVDNAEATTLCGRTVIQMTDKAINKKYNDEIGYPVEIELEDGRTLQYYSNNRVRIIRDNNNMTVKASEILETDEIDI